MPRLGSAGPSVGAPDISAQIVPDRIVPVALMIATGTNAYRPIASGNQLNDANAMTNYPGFALMLYGGAAWQQGRTPTIFKVINVLAVGAEATIWTPGAGKKFRLMGFALGASAAGTLVLRDNTAGTIIAAQLMAAGGPGPCVLLGNGILSAAANNVLTATLSVAGNLSGIVFGTEE
jgi:hypothetical protein